MKYVSSLLFNTVWAIHQDVIGPMMEVVKRSEDGIKLSDENITGLIDQAQLNRPSRSDYNVSSVRMVQLL